MDRFDIENKVKEILAEILDVDISKVNFASSLKDDLGMDSFDAVEIGFKLEDEFGINIPENDFALVEKVQDVIEYIVSRVGNNKQTIA